jgi:hypothetical protein
MSERSKKESPKQVLLALMGGYQTTQALYVVAKLGVADLLEHGPMSSEELAEKVGANSKSLFRVMRHLAALGVFTQDDSRKFRLTPTVNCCAPMILNQYGMAPSSKERKSTAQPANSCTQYRREKPRSTICTARAISIT